MNSDTDDEFHAFMVGRWPSLLRTAYLLTGSHHDAEDLAQAALARAYAKWDKVRHSDDMAAYVRKIMIHVHADRFRRRSVREWFTPWLPEAPVADPTVQVEYRSVLADALGRLPIRQRSALVLCYFEDMTHAQVAAVLGTRESTVRSQITRALAKLRQDGALAALTGRPIPARTGLTELAAQNGTIR
ncbi:SigE family RNA polymerase sigma factor [Streptomyces sp. NTH33]|uniref:SigE family RNA polymerase sigma factor n=1 Tax=Streptomyces sp. NTH33 TaxID=1735453 RepID=UPI000DA8754F|nr:SigE family RNA polymerase sigma factor [Streptomyces sp. NTH33]PZH17224.1 SigE family RNA polymerase sigma factor [Streptomyces sp. NTH33]